MSAGAGRMRVAVLVAVAACAGAVFVARSTAVAWSETAAARQALQALLATLAQSEPLSFPELPGQPPTDAERRLIEQQVAAYVQALHARDYGAAWRLIAPDTRGEWRLDSWRDYFAKLESTRAADQSAEMGGDLVKILLTLGGRARLGEVYTWGEAGVCRLTVEGEFPAQLALVRTPEGWRVDLEGTDDAQARLVVHRQVGGRGREQSFEGILRGALLHDQDEVPPNYLDCLALPGAGPDYRITDCRGSGDRMVVALAGRQVLELEVPLANGDQG